MKKIVYTILLLLLTCTSANAEHCSIQFNSLTEGSYSVIRDVSKNSEWVIYQYGEFEEQSPSNLYSIKLDTGKSGSKIVTVDDFHELGLAVITPDSSKVVYSIAPYIDDQFCGADSVIDDSCSAVDDFFSIDISGGEPIHLNKGLNESFGSSSSRISKDGTTLFLWNAFSIYSIPIDGSSVTQIVSGLTSINNVEFSDDDQWIVFRSTSSKLVGSSIKQERRLYSYNLESNQLNEINKPIVDGRGVGSLNGKGFIINPNFTSVTYSGWFEFENEFGLYRASIDGENSTNISGDLDFSTTEQGSLQSLDFFEFSQNQQILYFNTLKSGVFSLYGIEVDSSMPRFIANMPTTALQFSDDGLWAFNYNGEFNNPELHRISLNGVNEVLDLLPNVKPIDDFRIREWQLSPDESEIILIANDGFDSTTRRLFSVPVDGGDINLVEGASKEIILDFNFDNETDNSFLYRGFSVNSDSFDSQLFRSDLESDSSVRLDEQLGSSQSIFEYDISDDLNYVFYTLSVGENSNRSSISISRKLGECNAEEALCIPVKTKKGALAQICL